MKIEKVESLKRTLFVWKTYSFHFLNFFIGFVIFNFFIGFVIFNFFIFFLIFLFFHFFAHAYWVFFCKIMIFFDFHFSHFFNLRFLKFSKKYFFCLFCFFLQNNNIWKKKKIAIFPLLFFQFWPRNLLDSAGGLFQKIWRRFFRFVNYWTNIF